MRIALHASRNPVQKKIEKNAPHAIHLIIAPINNMLRHLERTWIIQWFFFVQKIPHVNVNATYNASLRVNEIPTFVLHRHSRRAGSLGFAVLLLRSKDYFQANMTVSISYLRVCGCVVLCMCVCVFKITHPLSKSFHIYKHYSYIEMAKKDIFQLREQRTQHTPVRLWLDFLNPFLPDCKTSFSRIFYIFYAIFKFSRPERDCYAKFTFCST